MYKFFSGCFCSFFYFYSSPMTVSTFSDTPPKNGKLELRSAGLIIAFLAES